MRQLATLLLCSLLLACASEPSEQLVNTPMKVAKVWLENYYHHNDYEAAKLYSTPQTSAMIDTIKTIIFPDQEGEKLKFKIKNVRCRQTQGACLLYTSPSPRDRQKSRMPSSA